MRIPIPASWLAWAETTLSLVYPQVCQLCNAEPATHAGGYVGEACRKSVRFIVLPYCDRCGRPFDGEITNAFTCSQCLETEHHFCWARSAVAAEGPVLEAIHKYKYNGDRWFERFLGELFVRAAASELKHDEWDALIPVPLWPTREREREFNQAERLARVLSTATGIAVDKCLLKRVIPTPSQTHLTRSARAENMRGAFALRRKQELEGQRIVIVDDVFTTGATTDACAKVLRKAGAERVAVWTLARGI